MKRVLIAVAICIGLMGLSLFSSCSKDYDEKVPEENSTENTVLTRAFFDCPTCGRYISDISPCMYCSNVAVFGYHCLSCKGKNVTRPYGSYEGSCNNCGSDPNWKGLEPCRGYLCSGCQKPDEGTEPPSPNCPIEEAIFIAAYVDRDPRSLFNPFPYIEAFEYEGVIMQFFTDVDIYGDDKLGIGYRGPEEITYICYQTYAHECRNMGVKVSIFTWGK